MNTLRTVTVSLFLGALGSSPVLAVPTGAQTLGVGADNIDVWQLVCPRQTSRAEAYVSDTVNIVNAARSSSKLQREQ